jgi:hypothetical protein
MRTPITAATLCAAALLLSACDRHPSGLPMPQVAPAAAGTGVVPAQAATVSVPSANAAASSAVDPAKPAPETGRSNTTMTRGQESSAMPMVGQNNDHSAPVAATKPASATR